MKRGKEEEEQSEVNEQKKTSKGKRKGQSEIEK